MSAHEMEDGEELGEVPVETTITLIVLILIALTIFFETMKEHIEESADRHLKPIIASLFGEMTVLGFLSIFTFCITKLGGFEELSVYLFGEQEEEFLLETFERVHYMLFFIMVFFVTSVLNLVVVAKEMKEKWWLMNRACCNPSYMAKLDQLIAVGSHTFSRNLSSWPIYFFESMTITGHFFANKKKKFRSELLLFRGLRSEFVLERSFEHPFSPNGTNQVEKDFDYGRYLGIFMGHELAHVVHVNNSTWLFFAALTVLFYCLCLFVEDELKTFAWIWAGTGWLLLVIGNFFDYHLQTILENLAAPPSPIANGHPSTSESEALLESSMPAWTGVDLDEYMSRKRPILARCFNAQSRPTKQDTLYWMERNGPKLYLVIFQIILIFFSAYSSLLILSFIPQMHEKTQNGEMVAFVIVSILPIIYVLFYYKSLIANISMVCSFGIHRRPQAITEVIRDEKVERIIRAMLVMQKLEKGAKNGFAVPGVNNARTFTLTEDFKRDHAVEIAQIEKTFDAIDASGDGKIENGELKEILRAIGAPSSKESLHAILKVLDSNENGYVEKDEFLAFYAEHVLSVDSNDLHAIAHDLYHQFDQDNNGQITLGEFKDVLDAFSVGFSVDEIGQLVNELDEGDNGSLGPHEFFALLKKHHHLFENNDLPTLE